MDLHTCDKLLLRTRRKLNHHLARLADDMSERARTRHERRASQLRRMEGHLRADLQQLLGGEEA